MNGERYVGAKVVLATGSYARTLPGLDIGGRIITSNEALRLDEVPRSVIVLGGGVIGVEFASVFKSFGADVTVVEALPRLVPVEDEFASKLLERAFRRRKIAFKTGVKFTGAKQSDTGVTVSLESGGGPGGGLPARRRGPRAQHGQRGLRGGGRAHGARLRAHRRPAAHEPAGRVRGRRHRPRPPARPSRLRAGHLHRRGHRGAEPAGDRRGGDPRVTYCEPEVASVGLTEAQARESYGDVQTLTYDLAGNGKSQILQTQGAIKLVKTGAEGTQGPVVGIHMVGARVGELIGEAQLV